MSMLRFLRFIPLLAALLAPFSGTSQTLDGPVGVAVTIKALDLQWGSSGTGSAYFYIYSLNGAPGDSVTSSDSETDQFTARLEPGKTYFLNISSEDLGDVTIQAVPPPGYVMEIERLPRERITLGYADPSSVRLRVRAPYQEYSGRAGTATTLTSGRVFWQASLGSLANGSAAGSLAIIDTGSGTTNWAQLFSPAGFTYEHTSSEVTVIYNPYNATSPYVPGTIRQILAPEACADVVITGTNVAEVKFYRRDQLVSGSGIRSFTGDPFAWYLINQDGSQPNKIYINTDLRDLPDLTSPGVSVVQQKHTLLERTGTAPNFTWTADQWYGSGGSASVDERVRSSGVETIKVKVPGGATAIQGSRTYGSVPWGEEIVSETRGTTNAVTTSYAFYTSSSQAGSYGRVSATTTTGGGWEAFEYYDYASGADYAGALYKRHRPFKNSDTSVPSNLASHGGEVTTYQYATDYFGRRTRPAFVETTVNGAVTARSATSYSEALAGFTGHPALYLVTATRNDSTANGVTLTTKIKYFREDAGSPQYSVPTDDFYRNQLHSIEHPDGRKQSFVYQRGTWSGGSSFTLSGNNGTDVGAASRITIISGAVSGGSNASTYAGYDIDDLNLIDKKSTAEITIRDQFARIVRTETHVWSSSAWNEVSHVDYGYNLSNQLTSRTTSNGLAYFASYVGEQKVSETSEAGVTLTYSPDTLGRPEVITKTAKGGIAALATKLIYDAAGHVVEDQVGHGQSEKIISYHAFDDAGRPASETPAGLGTTSFSYEPGSRQRTITMPGSATRLMTYFADGQLSSVTGSAVTPEHYDYGIESDGRRRATAYVGWNGSPRVRKAWTDWLSRTLKTERAGFTGQSAYSEDYTYESGTGRLQKLGRTGYSDTLFEYDALSRVSRQGLHFGPGSTLDPASNDRITDHDQRFENISGSWWLVSETKGYPFAGNNTAVTTSTTRRRLTGHATDQADETLVIDAEGNVSTSSTLVYPSVATTIVLTSSPALSNYQFDYSVNGLPVQTTSADGLTSSVEYDGLQRVWKQNNPRGKVAVTAAYYSGTAFVQTATDAASKVTTFGYDGYGRRTTTQDATGAVAYTAFDAHGQLFRQWGSGTNPVQYGYDATYGDRTTMTTYRGGTGWDGASWPSGTGEGDTTTWTYDEPSGLVSKKTDAANHAVNYTYNSRGQIATRTWARGVSATYTYSGTTGELTNTNYSDTTPDVDYVYTRWGQTDSVTQSTTGGGLGVRDFIYDSSAPWRLAAEDLGGFYGSRVLTQLYDTSTFIGGTYGPYTANSVKGRAVGFQLGVVGNLSRDIQQQQTYSNLGRFVGVNLRVASDSARDFVYNYKSPSGTEKGLFEGYSTGSFSVVRAYDADRDLVTGLESKWGSTSLTRFDYGHTDLGQRRWSKQSGSAFADYTAGTSYGAVFNYHFYDGKGQMQTTAMYRGDSPSSTTPSSGDQLPGRRFEYRYDNAGNRQTAGPTGTYNSADDHYTANALNQYDYKENNSVNILGTATAGTTVAASGGTPVSKLDRAYAADLVPPNVGTPAQGTLSVYSALVGGGPGGTDLIRTETRAWMIGPQTQTLGYDADGNLISDGIWNYAYDAENRLVQMTTDSVAVTFGLPNRSLYFKYDYAGRRVEKRSINTTASTDVTTRYAYDGTNLIAELDSSGTNILRTFTWGLDLAGSLDGSGGVGALVQIRDLVANKTFFVTNDANGNVSALVDASNGSLAATYEYSPFGELLRADGSYAKSNPFRFSTKFTDDESGLVYYGLRYYSPNLGRFINRDPIEEAGGLNLYGFCGNDGINGVDVLGMGRFDGGYFDGFYFPWWVFVDPWSTIDDDFRVTDPKLPSRDGGYASTSPGGRQIEARSAFRGRSRYDAIFVLHAAAPGGYGGEDTITPEQLDEEIFAQNGLPRRPREVIFQRQMEGLRVMNDMTGATDLLEGADRIENGEVVLGTGQVALAIGSMIPVGGGPGKRAAVSVAENGGRVVKFLRSIPWIGRIFGGKKAIAVAAEGIFKNGQIFERTIQTAKGPVNVLAETVVEGKTLHLKDIAIFGEQNQPLQGLTPDVFRALAQLRAEAKAAGFEILKITGERSAISTSKNPGHIVDRIIDLTK